MTLTPLQVFVTGASGFIGRHVVNALLARGHEVTAITRDPLRLAGASVGSRLRVIEADPFASEFRLPMAQGSCLIHLAWPHLDDYRSPAHFEMALPSSRELVRAAVAAGVEQAIVAGSCLEYGLLEGELAVSRPCCPVTAYGLAKLQLLQQLQILAPACGLNFQWVRFFYLHGPGQSSRTLMGQLEAAIARGDSTFPMSQGEQLRDYLDVRVAAQTVVRLLETRSSGVFNVCSGKPISVRRLVEERLRSAGCAMTLDLGRYRVPSHEPLAFWGQPSLPLAVAAPEQWEI